MDHFGSALLQNTLMLLIVPLMASGIVWLFAQGRLAWQKFAAEKPDLARELTWAAGQAVKAAEQAGIGGLIADKKKYAIDFVEKLLAMKGIVIDLDPIEAAIEAAVWDQINSYNPAKNPGYVTPPTTVINQLPAIAVS